MPETMPETITKPGIYRSFDVDSYYADPCPAPSFSQSIGKILLDRSPAHAEIEHPRLGPPVADDDDEPEKYDKAKAIGSAAHRLLIGRGKPIAIGDFDKWTTKEAKAFKAEHQAAGHIVILNEHMTAARHLADSIWRRCADAGWHDAFQTGRGDGEVVLAWQEPSGLWCRALVDWLNVEAMTVYDLKTSGLSCAPHNVGRLAADAGWDLQAAMIERGLHKLLPTTAGRWKFRFVATENEPPFAMTPVELSEHWLTMGRKKLEMALSVWSRCLVTGDWPAYPPQPMTPEYPGWKEQQWLTREIEHHDRRADHQNERPQRHADNLLAG